jgi:hypothetical protein
MLVFQLSGLLHLIGDVVAGVHWRNSGVMQWFSMQALGFVIEDSVITLYRKLTGSTPRPSHQVPTWQKVIGFIWVCCWMAWTMPVWIYPISRASEGEGVLPFGIVEYIL